MGITLALTPTINSLYTTLIHNGVVVPPNSIALFRIPRPSPGRYMSPRSEYNISWLNENAAPRITK